ncbi:MAG TPA: glycerate kinase [Micromonosporaceae bacterium]|nr:glycerate kinase [Micromonosporaceae bacterium]
MQSPAPVPGFPAEPGSGQLSGGREGQVVVIAVDKFKGSLSADEVAEALSRGLADGAAPVEVVSHPVSDGGEGMVPLLTRFGYEQRTVAVSDPLGRRVPAQLALSGRSAVVELAEASGLWRLAEDERDPRVTCSGGTGELILAAVAAGARDVLVAVGGSATSDGGAGLLRALGVSAYDAQGRPLPPGAAALAGLQELDLDGLDPRLADVTVTVACDVDNPLLGPAGAVHTFAAQKGARPQDLDGLESALRRWADVVEDKVGGTFRNVPGTGAAGGTAFALAAVLNGRLTSGIDVFLQVTGFRQLARQARLVITGEGSLDLQSLRGKAPIGVARAATEAGVPVIAVVGRSDVSAEQTREAGFARVYSLLERAGDAETSMREATRLLVDVGREIAMELS